MPNILNLNAPWFIHFFYTEANVFNVVELVITVKVATECAQHDHAEEDRQCQDDHDRVHDGEPMDLCIGHHEIGVPPRGPLHVRILQYVIKPLGIWWHKKSVRPKAFMTMGGGPKAFITMGGGPKAFITMGGGGIPPNGRHRSRQRRWRGRCVGTAGPGSNLSRGRKSQACCPCRTCAPLWGGGG